MYVQCTQVCLDELRADHMINAFTSHIAYMFVDMPPQDVVNKYWNPRPFIPRLGVRTSGGPNVLGEIPLY